MTRQEVFKLSIEKTLAKYDLEYTEILNRIKLACENAETNVAISFAQSDFTTYKKLSKCLIYNNYDVVINPLPNSLFTLLINWEEK